jgi:hypothetical protein
MKDLINKIITSTKNTINSILSYIEKLGLKINKAEERFVESILKKESNESN